ncbi:MAG: ferrous iron transport protein B [Bacteroidetes bacterium]|nr:MAG: ferrous iron transport protein B [Bacteroidota bacterium]
MADKTINVALLGNPNSGKTSLFNQLTGLNQKVGNFPGVTVDKKTGTAFLANGQKINILDLPGTYSLYAKSKDEQVVTDILTETEGKDYPDILIVTIDASNLRRNLLLLSQAIDLGLPTILALNMVDLADRLGKGVTVSTLEEEYQIPVVPINARIGEGIEEIKNAIGSNIDLRERPFLDLTELVGPEISKKIHQPGQSPYLNLHQLLSTNEIDEEKAQSIQTKDTTLRYGKINRIVGKVEQPKEQKGIKVYTDKIDKVLTHKFWGYFIFISILFIIFQAIFSLASWPMDLIDKYVSGFSMWLGSTLPAGVLTDLLKDGIVPGVGGVLIFIPQIAILFAFIALLEESGYMSRVVFLMDKIMRKVGLNGKSVVPLISGVACAIPAIMATRNIENWKERLITIFVTPLISCSARLPVYSILIALVIPEETVLGFLNIQGLVLLGLYLLGFIAALLTAWLLKIVIKTKERSFLIMELPTYKRPRWKNVGLVIIEKVRTFTFEAGKIIVAISIVLWVLASYGPAKEMNAAEENVKASFTDTSYTQEEYNIKVAAYKLEHSYAAILGKSIEPIIKPLGFDWKIGIALVTSFAAREVFVGTMATLYSVQSGSDEITSLKSKMKNEVNPQTGKLVFSLPVGLSLMIFYAFAMQCMSTLAIVYRETKGWKWPILQTIYMSALAYVMAYIVFTLFN